MTSTSITTTAITMALVAAIIGGIIMARQRKHPIRYLPLKLALMAAVLGVAGLELVEHGLPVLGGVLFGIATSPILGLVYHRRWDQPEKRR